MDSGDLYLEFQLAHPSMDCLVAWVASCHLLDRIEVVDRAAEKRTVMYAAVMPGSS